MTTTTRLFRFADSLHEIPRRSRDWDFEGTEEALADMIEKDRFEMNLIGSEPYLVDINGREWFSVWRSEN